MGSVKYEVISNEVTSQTARDVYYLFYNCRQNYENFNILF